MSAPAGWTQPGPGAWVLDRAHTVGPVTRILQDVFPDAMADGFRSFTGRYGLPISHIEVRYVNGYPYGAVRIAGVPPSDRPPPPAPLLRALVRVHPELRRRNRDAVRALDRRPWHDDLRRWFDELRPARLATVRALQAVEPETLDDAALADHVERCVAGLAAGLREHFSLVGAAGLPVGLYVLQQQERGRGAAEAVADLAGAAAGSTGATVPALAAIADALAVAGVEPAALDDVAAASPAAAAALDAYLEEYGQRVVGAFDVTGRRLVELPDVVLRTIAGARRGEVGGDATPGDDVLEDARMAVASRDDHAGISCMWPLGLARRALLAAGARLHDAGTLSDPDHVLDATAAEVTALLTGAPGAPGGAVLAARAAARHELAAAGEPPAVLGTPHPPPDPAVFPAGLRRTATAMAAFLGTMDAHGPTDGGTGVGVGRTVHRGRAVVAVDPEDAITRLRPGDVLVTSTTTPAFNCVLPIAGALVTAHGGPMGHAGIAARELGIPAVLGLADALDRIADGALVEVDPVAGTVRPAPAHVAFGPGVASPRVGAQEVGGKAAGLIAMSALGLPVPPGVVLPVAGIGADGVRAALAHLEELTGCRLGDPARPLIVSVRSGAAVSMPGMLDTLLDVGTTPEVAAALATTTGDPGFAEDTRRRFLAGWAAVVGGDVPSDPVDQVVAAALAVRRSWDGERARAFRAREGIDDDLGSTVTIQQMVFGNLGPDSGTAVVFSRDPSTGAPGIVGDLLVGAQGDDVVGGTHRTRPVADMASLPTPWPAVHDELVAAVAVLERHHADLVDVEVTVERGRLHLLQCRPGRRSAAAALRIAVDLADDPASPVDRAEAVARCRDLLAAAPGAVSPLAEAVVEEHRVAIGIAASPGRGVGALAVTVEDALRRHDAGEAVVLVRPHTAPADVAAMAVAAGIVTATGGLVSHAALVARSWGLPAVVGADDLVVEADGVRTGGRHVPAGTLVTVDGSAGLLLAGAHAAGLAAEPPEAATLRRWAADLDSPATPAPVAGDRVVTDLDVLRVVVLRGRTDADGIVAVTGAGRAAVDTALARLADAGQVALSSGTATATAAGRSHVADDVAAVVAEHRDAFARLLARFHHPDQALKHLITEQQLAAGSASDPVAALREQIHPEVLALVAAAAELVPRLARYAERLDTALTRLATGDVRYLAHPAVDSYHTIWFDLHDDLLTLSATPRAQIAPDPA